MNYRELVGLVTDSFATGYSRTTFRHELTGWELACKSDFQEGFSCHKRIRCLNGGMPHASLAKSDVKGIRDLGAACTGFIW
jgi:hypothetical protein